MSRTPSRRVGRRTALGVLGTTAVGAAAVACGTSAPPTPAPAKSEAKPAAADAAKPPAAAEAKPAAPATKPPEPAAKPADPAAKPAAGAAPAAAKPGPSLIGKLEGPSVVVDPAQFPKAFKEAPALADLVKQGKLPPVEQRIGQDPLVIKPVHEIGKYGGTWRRGFTGPGDRWNGNRAVGGPDHLLFWDYTGDKVVPNIAKGFELQDSGRVLVLQLRRGMKWSDGQPFTADDFVFWYEDMYLNKELVPTPSSWFSINGKQGKIEKVDQYTVRYVFPDPYYLLPDVLAGSTALTGHAFNGDIFMGSFAPAHYVKQFLPKYVGQAEADKKAKDAKFENWILYLKFMNDYARNPELPVVSPWKVVTPITTPSWTWERNPYSIWVDTDGNQLPYIDKVTFTLAENLEVLNLRAIAGEYDFQARHIDLGKLPVFLENQEKGGYKVYLDVGDYGGDMILKFNLSYDGDAEIAKWFGNTEFRRALSLGVDRDQINEVFWLGTGTPGSVVPVEANKYNPGPEYRKLWSTLDAKKANEMLDKLGLDKKDGEGFRQRTDGKGRLRIEVMTFGGQFVQFTRISEMIREHWKKIGIDLLVNEVERSLGEKRHAANDFQMYAWNNDGTEHLFTFPGHAFPFDGTSSGGPLYGVWFQTGGKSGKEPPPRLKEVYEKFRKAYGVPEAEKVLLAKDIWKIVADEVYAIGIVGLGAASQGVRVAKNRLGNIPSRMYNSPDGKTPGISRPMTFFWKS